MTCNGPELRANVDEINSRGQFHQHVYTQLLHAQMPKTQKKLHHLTVFFALMGSARIKSARQMLMKLTPDVDVDIKKVKEHAQCVQTRSRTLLMSQWNWAKEGKSKLNSEERPLSSLN